MQSMQYFRRGDLVWARAKNEPVWPAKIARYYGSNCYEVNFINDRSKAVIRSDQLFRYARNKSKFAGKLNTPKFKEAVRLADKMLEEGNEDGSEESDQDRENRHSNGLDYSFEEEAVPHKRKRQSQIMVSEQDEVEENGADAGRKKVRITPASHHGQLLEDASSTPQVPATHMVIPAVAPQPAPMLPAITSEHQSIVFTQSAGVQTITGLEQIKKLRKRVDALRFVSSSSAACGSSSSNAFYLGSLTNSLSSIATSMLVTETVSNLEVVTEALSDERGSEFVDIIRRIISELDKLKAALFWAQENYPYHEVEELAPEPYVKAPKQAKEGRTKFEHREQ